MKKIYLFLLIFCLTVFTGCATLKTGDEIEGWQTDGINAITQTFYDPYGYDYFGFDKNKIHYKTKKMEDLYGKTRCFYAKQYAQYEPYRKIYKQKKEVENLHTVYTGPRGGKYYINSKGKKTYIRKKK